jgi:hypothetical protein
MIARPDSIDVLNRLLQVEYRSLAVFVAQISPWTRPSDEPAAGTLRRMVEGQSELARRIAEMIQDRGEMPDLGVFPIEFAELNLLSLDFLLSELARRQRVTVSQIEEMVRGLSHDRAARELAEEVLGTEKAHLEMFEELQRQPA